MPGPAMIVGLGNPGAKYSQTRHNAGFMAVATLAIRSGISLTGKKLGAVIGQGMVAQQKSLLVLPQTYMNLSGQAVASLAGYYRIDPESLVVVHDEVDLPFGTLRAKSGGGMAGHKGLLSIAQHLKTNDFLRVRIGVGRSDIPEMDTANWVLGRFDREEAGELPSLMDRAADCVETILNDGITEAMNVFNAREQTGGE